jgi:hypothetical protein
MAVVAVAGGRLLRRASATTAPSLEEETDGE